MRKKLRSVPEVCDDPRHGPRGYIQHGAWGLYHLKRGRHWKPCERCGRYRLDCGLDPREYDYEVEE